MESETPSHFRFEPSFSLASPSFNERPAARRKSLHSGETEASNIEFHQSPLGMHSADTEMTSVAVSPRGSTSMPIDMRWPLHKHPLVYAGTVQHDGSVAICTCKNCGQEHYNSAVYSCMQCQYHVCLACAIEQQSASHKIQVVDTPTTPAPPTNIHRTRRHSSSPASPSSPRAWIAPGAVTFNLGLIAPINYDTIKFKKEQWHIRRWSSAVETDAKSFSMRLAFPCSFHPSHTLHFYPSSPSLGIKNQHGLTGKLFCDASQSDMCASYELNKHPRPFYACSECQYRLCMPCYRIYMADLRQQVSVPERALKEVQRSIERSRELDHTAAAYGETILQNFHLLGSDARDCSIFAGVGTLYSLILINAMITQSATGIYAAPLLDCVILSVMSLVPSLIARMFFRYVIDYHHQLITHERIIENLYSNPSLEIVTQGFEPSTIAASALKPRELELINSLYHHQASYFRKQSRSVIMMSTALICKAAAIGLLIASIVYLFVSVICDLPAYDNSVSSCELRSAIPIGLGLFICLGYPLVWRLVEVIIGATLRRADLMHGKSQENKRASKRARLDYA